MLPPQVSIPPSAKDQGYRFASAYEVLEKAIEQGAFPGAAFGVLHQQEIVALDGVGRFTYDPRSSPVTASTIYDLASITKVIATTSMAMLLWQRNLLALDEPIIRWLPDFACGESAQSARRQVTVRMLLTHSSGLPGYARLFEVCHGAEELFDACQRLPLEAHPGARTEYSDPGFILLGRILEKIASQPLESFVDREIFLPLGMHSTRFLPMASWKPQIAPTEDDSSFRRRVMQGEVQDENCFVLGGVSGHAGLFSNALDPLLYGRHLLQQAGSEIAASSPGLFTESTIRLFTTRADIPPCKSRALGWDTPSIPSSSGKFFHPHSAGHLGYAGTSLWIDFDAQMVVTLLTNRTWPHRQSELIRQVRPAFHDAIVNAAKCKP